MTTSRDAVDPAPEPADPRAGRRASDAPGGRSVQRAPRAALRAAAAACDRDQLGRLLDELAARAAAGDEGAVETLVWAVDDLGLARPVIRGLLVNDADVDDVAQDVLVAVAETIGRFRGDARFTTWLHQVARFKAIAHLRRKRSAVALPGDGAAAGVDLGSPGDAQRISSLIATRASLGEVLRSLPSEYRDPVVLRDVEGLPYDQLARRLHLNVNTAKSRVARGRALVAARLAVR
jgi:RNA polymerase sigma-70 factor, ECF subfamily